MNTPDGFIRMISGWFSDSIFRHDLQLPQGLVIRGRFVVLQPSATRWSGHSDLFSEWSPVQLHAMANVTAALFFPTPSIPVNRRA
jgi:hypothetical protein